MRRRERGRERRLRRRSTETARLYFLSNYRLSLVSHGRLNELLGGYGLPSSSGGANPPYHRGLVYVDTPPEAPVGPNALVRWAPVSEDLNQCGAVCPANSLSFPNEHDELVLDNT